MSNPVMIMAAPNGARKTKDDHPALPVDIAQTVAEARACYEQGACALHAHVRDSDLKHTLDAGLYRELLKELQHQVPKMLIQITTEAVGIYTPGQQAECVKALQPEMCSVAIREMAGEDKSLSHAQGFYHWCQENRVHVQHILFDQNDLMRFFNLREQGVIPAEHNCVLYVLGRYTANLQSTPADIQPFIETMKDEPLTWFVCAFGHQEQDCMLASVNAGGHARIGFENNLYAADGNVAESTASQIANMVQRLTESGRVAATADQARKLLNI